MIVKVKCPQCGEKITFNCYSENRKQAKKLKEIHKINFDILKTCFFIHKGY